MHSGNQTRTHPLSTGLHFVVLGPVCVVVDDHQRSVTRAQTRGVLALLALNAGRALSRPAVTEALWGGAAPTTARAQVHNAIRQIRGLLAEAGQPGLIETGSFGYRLRVAPELVDAGRFDQLLEQARGVAERGDYGTAGRLFRAGLNLWSGEPLLDAAGSFVEPTRARLVDVWLTAIEDLADLDLRHGRPELVAAELAPIVHSYPLRERLLSRLMLALYRSGRPSDALRVCREYRQLLAEREGLDPGPKITELERLVLRADPSLAPPAAEAVPKPTAAPAPQAMPRPAQLPPDLATFTGRETYLSRLDALLPGSGPSQPIVISAVSGAAGFGKTALAIHWGHRVRARFPDGQLFVDLRGYASGTPLEPIRVLAGFLRALGVTEAQVPEELHEACGLFRSLIADRRMLLVLDNARGVEQIRPLLPGGPACMVVVTSRDRLDGLVAVDGADRIDLDVLAPDEAFELLRRVIPAERVDAEQARTVELARLCAYLPLALRIAAARLITEPHRRVDDLVTELSSGSRLSALAVRGDERAAVRATFELSYRGLPPAAQRMFRLISLAPGPDLTVAAVAALVDSDEGSASRQLAVLTGANLVEERGDRRFALHDLLRVYARERAEEDEDESGRTAAWIRLLGYYLSTVDCAARLVSPQIVRLPVPADLPAVDPGFTEAAAASAWLDVERANLVAAIVLAADIGPCRSAWLLADALRGYFGQRICAVEWRAAAEAGLAAAEAEDEPTAQAAGQLSLAGLHQRLSRYRESIRRHSAALTLAERGGWLAGQAAILNNLASLYHLTGRPAQAEEIYEKALALNRRTGDVNGEAVQLGNLGALLAEQGRIEEAIVNLDRALALYRKTGARAGEGWALSTLGSCYQELSRLAEAREHSEQALRLLRELGDRSQELVVLRILAILYAELGRYAEALDLGRESLALAREVGQARAEAGALVVLGEIHYLMGESARCIPLYEDALALSAGGHLAMEVSVGLAAAHQHVGDPAHARRNAEQALAAAREAGYSRVEALALTVLARVNLDEFRTDEAVRQARESVAVLERMGYRLGLARSLLVLGEAVSRAGDPDTAAMHWERALDLFVDAESIEAERARALIHR